MTTTITRAHVEPAETALRDGTVVLVRPLEPGDGDMLRAFHRGLPARTAYYRFLGARGPLTEAEVEYLTHVDQRSRVVLGAFADDRLVAVARYERIPGTSDAEVACVVKDEWQGRGAGTAVLARLVEVARRSGVRRFVTETLLSNTRMLRLLSGPAPTTLRCVSG